MSKKESLSRLGSSAIDFMSKKIKEVDWAGVKKFITKGGDKPMEVPQVERLGEEISTVVEELGLTDKRLSGHLNQKVATAFSGLNDALKNKGIRTNIQSMNDEQIVKMFDGYVKKAGTYGADTKYINAMIKETMSEAKTKGEVVTGKDLLKMVRGIVKDDIETKTINRLQSEIIMELSNYTKEGTIQGIMAKHLNELDPRQLEMSGLQDFAGNFQKLIDEGNPDQLINFSNRIPPNVNKALTGELYKTLVGARSVVLKGVAHKKMKLDVLTKYTGTMTDAINFVGQNSENPAIRNKMHEAHTFIETMQRVYPTHRKVGIDLHNKMSQIPEEKTRHIVAYIEELNNATYKDFAMVDGVEQFPALAQKLGLSTEDLYFANQLINFHRIDMQNAKMLSERNYNSLANIRRIDQLDGNTIMLKDDMSNNLVGDVGAGYFHHKMKKEYLSEVSHSTNKFGDGGTVSSRQARITDKHTGVTWNEDGSFVINDSNRMTRADEFKEYILDTSRKIPRKHFQQLLNEAKAINSTTGSMTSFGDLTSYRQTGEAITHLQKHFELATEYAPETDSVVLKALEEIIDFDSTVMLFNPRLWLFNALGQPMSNSANWKGVMNIVNSYKEVPALLKESLKHSKLIKKTFTERHGNFLPEVIDGLAKRKGLDEHSYVFESYFKNFSDDKFQLEMFDAQQALLKIPGTDVSLRNIANVMRIPFELSDLSSRVIGLSAASRKAEQMFARYGNNMDDPKTLNRMMRELGLEEFGYFARKELMELLTSSDKNGFISRYAAESINAEMFNYNQLNRPFLLDMAKQHKLLGLSTRFTSWGMYYANLFRQSFRAYEEGNTKPLQALTGISLAWLTAMSVASNSDINIIEDYANYGIGRTPGVSMVTSPASIVSGSRGGIMTPYASTVVYAALTPFTAIETAIKKDGTKDSGLQWTRNEARRSMRTLKNRWLYRQMETLLNLPFGED